MCDGVHSYIPVANVARAEVYFDSFAQEIENVYSVYNPTGWDAGSLADLVAALDTWVQASLMPNIGTQTYYRGVKATDLSSSSGPIAEHYEETMVPGSVGAGTPMPNNICAVFSWKTASRGRSYRGRTYIPGMRSTFIDGDTFTSVFTAAISLVMSGLRSDMSSQGWVLGVTSLCNGKAWRSTGVFTPFTALVLNNVVATQRRRLTGRGN